MSFIPEWAPNIHPVLIHFPIVLLMMAPMLDAGAIIFKKQRWLLKNANLVYALAGLSVLIVYVSGRFAADSVEIPTQAYTTLSTHANWALYTLILGGANAALRGYQLFRGNEDRPFQWFLIIPGLVVVVLLFFTADNGAKLVYAHGVGVTVMEQVDHHSAAEEHSYENSADVAHHDGRDYDSASQTSETELEQDFEWILGDAESVNLKIAQEHDGDIISLKLDMQEALFVLPEIYTNLEFTAKVNRDEFKGNVRLVHHASNANNYDLLELGDSTLKLGRVKNGGVVTFDSGNYDGSGWLSLKVVGTKGHFRGYVNQKLVAHGHGADLPPGKIGVYAKGSGILKLSELSGKILE